MPRVKIKLDSLYSFKERKHNNTNCKITFLQPLVFLPANNNKKQKQKQQKTQMKQNPQVF